MKQADVKVTATMVRAIRAAAAEGKTYAVIAGEFGISATTVWEIVTRRTWADVD